MHREGHLGVALAVYAPIGSVAIRAGFGDLAFFGAGLAAALSTLPDVDTKLPLVTHRGYTHTVWFAGLVGAACAVLAGYVPTPASFPSATRLAAFCFVVGATSICSHVAADGFTPMGVRPFAPFGDRRTLGVVRSANRVVNLVLLVFGTGVLVSALLIASEA